LCCLEVAIGQSIYDPASERGPLGQVWTCNLPKYDPAILDEIVNSAE
jgi:hypothetical protein